MICLQGLMQNAGQQYGQGGASSHPGAPYGHTDSSTSNGSITSSLRQFRKKDVEKQQVNDTGASVAESHVARVAPHNHYPPRPTECYRYPSQFQDYSLSSQVKYSEISDPQPLQEQLSPTVIQKAKGKEYMDMCNVQQTHMKQPYPDHLNSQQSYPPDSNPHGHAQYLQKDPQVHPPYKPESQYFPKEPQYQQLPHQIQKYNMPTQIRKYPENDFLSKLRRIHPTMARSIMSDHHLQESQPSYQAMDQNRMYPHQNQRYMNYSSSMQSNPYPPSYMPPQHYSNYPASCSYTRPSQMGPRFPSMNNHERSLSPRRGYTDNLPIPPMNYTGLPQKISPNYSQYNSPEYAQHYQHRRPAMAPQEYYQQHCRTTQYLPHQMPSQEISENRVTVSDSIKQYIENWADEETASEMNQIETNRMCKENLRIRDDQSTETVYMINASELQYLENGIPLVTSENGIPLVAENGQYILKSGVAIDNSTGMVRIVEKTNHLESSDNNMDRVVNLHIMDPLKPDCMLASKPNELNQKQNSSLYNTDEKPRVVIHQNTVIQPGQQNIPKEPEETGIRTSQNHNKISNNLPLIADNEASLLEKFDENIFKECKKQTVDKNCSPINVEQMEKLDEFQETTGHTSVICPTKLLEHTDYINRGEEEEGDGQLENSNDLKLKNMPIIDLLAEEVRNTVEGHGFEAEKLATDAVVGNVSEIKENLAFNLENISKDEINEEKVNSDEDVRSSAIATNEEEANANCKNMDSTDNNSDINNIKENSCETDENIKNEFKEEMEEPSKISANLPKNTNGYIKEEIITKEDPSENKVRGDESDNVENKAASKVANRKIENEETVAKESNIVLKSESEETVIDQEEVTTENNKEKMNGTVISNSENTNLNEIVSTSTSDDANTASENITKPSIKRSRRIFSVDDIINNIGSNMNKCKAEKERAERRRSLQLTREFLDKEINHSHTFLQKLEALKEIEIKKRQTVNVEKTETKVIIKETEKMYLSDHQLTEALEDETNKNYADDTSNEKQHVEGAECKEQKKIETNLIKFSDDTEDALNCDANSYLVENKIISGKEKNESRSDCTDLSIEKLREGSVCNNDFSEIALEPKVPSNVNEESTLDNFEGEIGTVLNLKQTEVEVTAQNEVHYRNAIRVEENSVLLQIAGELVEINVSNVNGKKVITVVPMSESTIVDFNDNYEMLENNEIGDQTKTDIVEAEHDVEMTEIASIDEVIPEPDIIETTSEIIIGMDISLEEEIQLDLEKPQVVFTKAAKKAYENDLQIPSITTSEDINDNNKIDSYPGNDKVSSSKEQHPPKDKSEKRKSAKIDSSKKKDNAIVKRPKCLSDKNSDPDKKALRELLKEEDEFVPFKDLVQARRLKKLKLQQLKGNENVSADSTNKVDQEENSESPNESKSKRPDVKDKGDEEIKKIISTENKEVVLKTKEHKPNVSKTPLKKEIKAESKNTHNTTKEDNQVNSSTTEKREINDKANEKGTKKVTFGPVNYFERQKPENPHTDVRNFKLQDPRLKGKSNGDIIVPSVSEILKENERLENSKKKLSLEEYNNRKRKLSISINSDGGDKEAKFKKIKLEDSTPREIKLTHNVNKCTNKIVGNSKDKQTDETRSLQEKADQVRMPRPKSLDDLKMLAKPKDNFLAKRKLSLEVTSYKPNYFDWEETQSPKTNPISQENSDRRVSEFSGLINNNKSKIVIDINDLNPKPAPSENSEDEILQNYKEQVDSKLSSLNIQIPRVAKPSNNVFNPFSKPETNNLMQRFLKNEKITYEEMEKIKKIISYKRLVQQLKRIKSPDLASPSLNPSYEIRKNCAEKEMKLHLKKVPGKRSKQRFRNLYSESANESVSDFSDTKKNDGDYSVVQSNCFAAGVPKLIIKRKTEMPVPVVRLERLDLDLLVKKKRNLF
ncbi:hypothetical protein NQ314_007319 [Rhamnusium bicolor]|uniref:C2H2-type domain-containing protein n=1 Tax=Rhamnusium bicolor TaxID=1586634 RepID=A0AAV8YSN3_9CUCU|nr:hypothetical protein NQ314_007319 [Rhamnusium bicolor]